MTIILDTYNAGGIIAYPTEAVFGLGCDPDNIDAINKLLTIKNRPIEKGLILLAGTYEQLIPYIDQSRLGSQHLDAVLSRWPNGITQVLPAASHLSKHLVGNFDSIAVRVTSQPDVVALCELTGKPIVSTSANLTGNAPAQTWESLDEHLLPMIDFVVKGETLKFEQPSTIIDGITGEIFRA